MTYSPRPRRFRRVVAARIANAGLITAEQILILAGIPEELADRFAGAFTTAVKAARLQPTATTWTKHRGRARKTAAYALDASLLGILLAYRPGGKPQLLKNGQLSRSKKEKARQKLVAEWTRLLFGPMFALAA